MAELSRNPKNIMHCHNLLILKNLQYIFAFIGYMNH